MLFRLQCETHSLAVLYFVHRDVTQGQWARDS